MKRSDIVEDLDLPQTQVAQGAWDGGVRRVRRRRAGIVAGAAVLTAGVIVTASLAGDPGKVSSPAPAESPGPTPDVPQTVAPEMKMPPVFTDQAWGRLSDAAARIRPTTDNTVNLSGHPLNHAVLAIGDPEDQSQVLVLGEDGLWRRVDGVDLVPVNEVVDEPGSALRATSLSPDATKLALPQPDSLVVVDLTTGASRRYEVPGPSNLYAIWTDASHVLVAEETALTGTMVDLGTGNTEPSDFGPSTAFSADGLALTWGHEGPMTADPTPMQWSDGTTVSTLMNNLAAAYPLPPLVSDDVVVGDNLPIVPGLGLDTNHGLESGIVVVDRTAGNPLAYLPTVTFKGDLTKILGWDGDRIVLALVNPNISAHYTAMVAWDWKQQTLDPLVILPGWEVAWGQGWAEAPAAN